MRATVVDKHSDRLNIQKFSFLYDDTLKKDSHTKPMFSWLALKGKVILAVNVFEIQDGKSIRSHKRGARKAPFR